MRTTESYVARDYQARAGAMVDGVRLEEWGRESVIVLEAVDGWRKLGVYRRRGEWRQGLQYLCRSGTGMEAGVT